MDRAGIVLGTKSGETALYRAAEDRKEEIVFLLIESDAYLPESPQIGVTSMASPREYKAVGELLLNQMGDAESITRKRLGVVLYWAVLNGHETLVQECAKNGQDLKSWTQNGATLLHVAASNGHKKLVSDLLEIEGVDIEAKTKDDVTAMHLAAGNGHDAVVSVLLEKLKEPDRWLHTIVVETTDGETALSLAVKRKHQQVEQLLWTEMEKANLEADPEAADKALIWAARLEKPGQERILGLLLKKRTLPEKGGWLDKPEEVLRMASDRWTTLHWAVYHGRLEVVWWLLVRGGHLRAKDMGIAKTIAKKMNRIYI
jgi:ankyrin repeat protein